MKHSYSFVAQKGGGREGAIFVKCYRVVGLRIFEDELTQAKLHSRKPFKAFFIIFVFG